MTTYKMELGIVHQGMDCPVFPMLMREGWNPGTSHLRQKLIRGVSLAGVPDVALVCLIPGPPGSPPSRAFYKQERLQHIGRQQYEVEQEALYNLSRRPGSWQVMEPGPGDKLALCSDDYLAAERCLDAAFIGQVYQLLGTDSVVLGIPARGQLMAAPMSSFAQGSVHARTFKMMVDKLFAEAGELAISPLLFWHIKGGLNTVLEVQ